MKKNIFKKVLPYKMRNAAMALAATVAGMTTTSCEEDEILQEQPKKEIKEPVVKKNKYYNMYLDTYEATPECPADTMEIDYIISELAKEDTDTMFLVPRGKIWSYQNAEIVSQIAGFIRKLERIDPNRIWGAGPINFKPGEPSKVGGDSAYLVSRGFPINPVKSR